MKKALSNISHCAQNLQKHIKHKKTKTTKKTQSQDLAVEQL